MYPINPEQFYKAIANRILLFLNFIDVQYSSDSWSKFKWQWVDRDTFGGGAEEQNIRYTKAIMWELQITNAKENNRMIDMVQYTSF